jgi:hypothetical protein
LVKSGPDKWLKQHQGWQLRLEQVIPAGPGSVR